MTSFSELAGQRQRKDRTARRGTCQRQCAAMQFRGPPRNRQPEAAAPRLGREERLEYAIADLQRHARAGVADVDRAPAAGVCEGHGDRAVSVHRLRRIQQQIQHRRPNHLRIGGHQHVAAVERDVDRRGDWVAAQSVDGLLEQRPQRERGRMRWARTRKHHQVVDQVAE